MKTTKIDFKDVHVEDLEGTIVMIPDEFRKDFGNRLYTSAPGIEPADLGRKIYFSWKNNEDLILNQPELKLFIDFFDTVPLLGHPARLATLAYLNEKLETLKNL